MTDTPLTLREVQETLAELDSGCRVEVEKVARVTDALTERGLIGHAGDVDELLAQLEAEEARR
jgi:hypothetical protein